MTVFTFGAPRAVFKSSIPLFEGITVYSYRNDSDIVPTLPHRFIGMRHPLPPIQLGNVRARANLGDHAIGKYVEKFSNQNEAIK